MRSLGAAATAVASFRYKLFSMQPGGQSPKVQLLFGGEHVTLRGKSFIMVSKGSTIVQLNMAFVSQVPMFNWPPNDNLGFTSGAGELGYTKIADLSCWQREDILPKGRVLQAQMAGQGLKVEDHLPTCRTVHPEVDFKLPWKMLYMVFRGPV